MERQLEYWPPGATVPLPIHVHVGIPEPDAGGPDWSCTLTIDGFETPYVMSYPGVDALSALLRALRMAPIILRSRTPDGGRLTWLGDEDLGFGPLSSTAG